MAFRLSTNADASNVSGLADIELLPIDLVEMFGKPSEGDGKKVSGEFIFANDKGDVFTIHDWKATTLFWGEDSGCLTPEEFWQDDEIHTFYVGGNNRKRLSIFMKWLCDEFEKPKLPVLQRRKVEDSKKLLPVYIDGKDGYIDTDGDLVFDPVFDEASTFSDGLALVKIENYYGYIDCSGKFVIEPVYEDASSFTEGVAVVKRGRKRFVIDTKGSVLFKIPNRDFYRISEGLICIKGTKDSSASVRSTTCNKNKRMWGYVDKSGVPTIPFQFDWAIPFAEGLARVCLGRDHGYIDKLGKMAFKVPYRWRSAFSEGFARFQATNRKYGFIDRTGNQIIPAKFDWTGIFREGMAAARVKNKWGFINTDGDFVIEPQFEDAPLSPSPFKEDLACVKFGELFGFINKKGEMVIPPIFRVPCSFSNGIAGYRKGGYINKEGKYIWHPDKNQAVKGQ
jgi:hypothetical protein